MKNYKRMFLIFWIFSDWSGGRQRTGSVVSLEGSEQPASGSERVRSQSVQPTSVTTPTLFVSFVSLKSFLSFTNLQVSRL